MSFLYPCRSALVSLPFLWLLKGRLQIKTYGVRGSFNDKLLFQLPDGDRPCILRFNPYDRSRISNEVVVSKGCIACCFVRVFVGASDNLITALDSRPAPSSSIQPPKSIEGTHVVGHSVDWYNTRFATQLFKAKLSGFTF
ncbi:MAG: hypothetical protein J3Q66DRAFT_387530 [Benniella sp.]|nr:MAG: hypothetical protein J3Q66DRAFT_387527 [Benniella sp.]KAK3818627.1 MAG: hypothetical protein J3Q66DRAFT_387530 [Benniella sp.]